ncbi:hypothetical protein Tco_0173150 [Tanacetum coccineum]
MASCKKIEERTVRELSDLLQYGWFGPVSQKRGYLLGYSTKAKVLESKLGPERFETVFHDKPFLENQENQKEKKHGDERGTIIKIKNDSCTRVQNKRKVVDYDKVFAPVARIDAISLFLALAKMCMSTAPGLKILSQSQNKVSRVVKALYGLHQPQELGIGSDNYLWIYKSSMVKDLKDFKSLKGFSPAIAVKGSLVTMLGHKRRSTSGGCQYLGRRLVSWQCKKQTIVAISSTEAEYVAAASCCAQVLWMQNQLLDYGFNFMNTEIHIDNESTICIVKNPVFHSKTKHIQIRHHFIRDCYEQRLINVVKVHTDDNVADLLTKGFDLARFNFLVVTIGMMNP